VAEVRWEAMRAFGMTVGSEPAFWVLLSKALMQALEQ